MSRKYNYTHYFKLLDEVNQRYQRTREGYKYDFKEEIEPFLQKSVKIIDDILLVETDDRFTEPSKDKLISTFNEMSMSCHAERMSMRLFTEQAKYINVWLKHIELKGL